MALPSTPWRARDSPTRSANALKSRIVAEHRTPGDSLPTEAELAKEYGVSRTVVREAGRILVEWGLVEIGPGRGMVVAQIDGRSLSRQFGLILEFGQGSFEQLMEMRLTLEISISRYAAQRRTAEDLERIYRAVAGLSDSSDEQVPGLRADLEFHTSLATAAHNPFFERIANPINSYLRDVYESSLGYQAARRQTIDEHEAIAQAIAAGDPDAAESETIKHLVRVRDSSQELTSGSQRNAGDTGA